LANSFQITEVLVSPLDFRANPRKFFICGHA
jgi:hypothetical protein